jgi:hypothetical protein
MIKINLNNADEILKFHYENLNTGTNHVLALLQAKIDGSTDSIKDMYQELFDNVKMKDKYSILTAKPQELEAFFQDFEEKYKVELKTKTKDSKGKDITIKKDLLSVFYYTSYEKWKSYELAHKINVKVCPYCNRNYTFVVGSDKNRGTRFQYDHFLKKSQYPYLALSFYNLVPSCKVCNSDLKGEKAFLIKSHIHPYHECFGDDLTFSISVKDAAFLNGKPKAYRIRLKRNNNAFSESKFKRMYANVRVFKLLKLYNMHKDYVDELIQKSYVYKDGYVEDLYKTYPDLFTSIDDVKRMALGNYINEVDFGKRPLSKLTRDIAQELGLLK